jgi:pimeloyl-ACP methyl ester carboxylesterase
MRAARRRPLIEVILGAILLSGIVATVPASPAGPAPTSAATTWSACFEEFGPFECTIVRVPLDYDRPGGAKISLPIVRLPAADPARRQGSLFVNPGGPGGSGVDFVVSLAPFLLTQDVRDQFDIVGFDPRGILRSDQLRCFDNPAEWEPYFTPFTFPITRAETRQWIAADRYLDRACSRDGGRILDHMSTANVARDLDRLRVAVGDRKLSFIGYSYGTMIGQTYANMFPNRFRAIVVDGVLDPIAWTTGAPGQRHLPFSTRLRSDQGAMASLRQFFRLCDAGRDACPLSGEADDRFAAIARALQANPLRIEDPETGEVFEYNHSQLIADVLRALYSSFSWPAFAEFLAVLETVVVPPATAREQAAVSGALGAFRKVAGLTEDEFPEAPAYQNLVEGFPGVACSDSSNPDSYGAWSRAGAAADRAFGYFGRLWTWASSICAEWPGHDADRYPGPWTRRTDRPVLVVGTRYDPATRYQGAQIAHRLLPNSVLLTVDGWAHTSLFLSACADRAITDYLVLGRTPRAGAPCSQDAVPWVDFGLQPVEAAAAGLSRGEMLAERAARAQLAPPALWRGLN